jgi:hypothetical protein
MRWLAVMAFTGAPSVRPWPRRCRRRAVSFADIAALPPRAARAGWALRYGLRPSLRAQPRLIRHHHQLPINRREVGPVQASVYGASASGRSDWDGRTLTSDLRMGGSSPILVSRLGRRPPQRRPCLHRSRRGATVAAKGCEARSP